jgi:hypothetical protein
MVEDIDAGKVETYSMDQVMDKLKTELKFEDEELTE